MKIKDKILTRRAFPRILIALAASVAAMGVSAQGGGMPQFRLMLGIVVEGLDEACIGQLRDHLGEGGFRMFAERGIYIQYADYGTPLDATAATATLVSGAHPALSGIDSELKFDRERMRYAHVFADTESMGNYTREAYSPRALRVSTISDEVRIAGGGLNNVYAVAPTPGQAIALAGHSGNVALWIDRTTGNWASSTYYREMPVCIATRNRANPLSLRMDTMSWAPSADADVFGMLPEHLTRYPFRYVFPRSNPKRIEMFMASPLMNNEVTVAASELLTAAHLGTRDEGMDVLQLGYSLVPYPYGRTADKRLEQLDACLRLDRNLEQLFSAVDRTVGLEHTLIYLAGTPARPYSPRDDEKWGIPYGEFSTRRAASLLNIYLIALHGNGDYVSAFRNGRLYLNQRIIKEKGLDAASIRQEAASFLARMSGIDRVYTAETIISGSAGENADAMRRNTSVASACDITVLIAPGFELIDDFDGQPAVDPEGPHYVRRAVAATAPVFILAPGLQVQRITIPVDARSIAPTVTRLLRIRSPNGAVLPPLATLAH